MEENDFYKKQYFDELNERISNIEKKIDVLSVKVDTINNKLTYIYAYATGASVVAAVIIKFLIR